MLPDPPRARALYDQYFSSDESSSARNLLHQLEERERLAEFELRSEWLADYHEAQVQCTRGNAISGVEQMWALPVPPELKLIREPWPQIRDLYQALVEHMYEELDGLGEPVEGSPEQVLRENQIDGQADGVLAAVRSRMPGDEPLRMFAGQLQGVRDEVSKRQAIRQEQITTRIHLESLDEQEKLLELARAYTDSGDFIRALNCFEEILNLDATGKVRPVIEPEMNDVRRLQGAVVESTRLAREGHHLEAREVLVSAFGQDAGKYILPWMVESFPTGVRVTVGDNSRVYETPFEIQTTIGRRILLVFEEPGFQTRRVLVNEPANLLVYLSRQQERWWKGSGRIDAVPVSVGEDHIVVDRKGTVARIGEGGELRWTQSIDTLSGIARAPVFMPRRPGFMLMITEDGSAWVVNAESGDLEGPWELGSPPVLGPYPDGGMVRVFLADGLLAS